jgi:hypothetical protein
MASLTGAPPLVEEATGRIVNRSSTGILHRHPTRRRARAGSGMGAGFRPRGATSGHRASDLGREAWGHSWPHPGPPRQCSELTHFQQVVKPSENWGLMSRSVTGGPGGGKGRHFPSCLFSKVVSNNKNFSAENFHGIFPAWAMSFSDSRSSPMNFVSKLERSLQALNVGLKTKPPTN